jgi:putative hemolysin
MQTLRFNSLEVRLAETEADADAAQALRYRIFYDEIGAKPTPSRKKLKRDVDPYDDICDHLLVIDLERGSAARPEVVGT